MPRNRERADACPAESVRRLPSSVFLLLERTPLVRERHSDLLSCKGCAFPFHLPLWHVRSFLDPKIRTKISVASTKQIKCCVWWLWFLLFYCAS